MLFGNEKLFSLVRSAKLGQVGLPPVLAELREWIHAEFGVSVVHVVFDHVEIGASIGRPRLNVILETDAEYESWQTGVITIRPDVNRRVLAEFTKLALSNPATYDTDNVFLILDNFSDECLGRACSAFLGGFFSRISGGFLNTNVRRIMKKFADARIWRIDGFSRDVVVFLKTTEDIRLKTADGTCAAISERCFEAIKQYDEFGYLTGSSFRLKFDSKENLDKNFNGNLRDYWR